MVMGPIQKRLSMSNTTVAVPASTYLQTHTDLGAVPMEMLKTYTFDSTAPEPGKDAIYHNALLELRHPSGAELKPTTGFVVYSEDPIAAKQAGRDVLPVHFLVPATYRNDISGETFYTDLENVQARPGDYSLQVKLGTLTEKQEKAVRMMKAVSRIQ